jgi:hypothetical protein
MSIKELWPTIPTLWDTARAFTKEHPEHVAEDNSMKFISRNKGIWYNGCHCELTFLFFVCLQTGYCRWNVGCCLHRESGPNPTLERGILRQHGLRIGFGFGLWTRGRM